MTTEPIRTGSVPARMSRDEYRRWAEQQRGRFERFEGEPIAMAAERLRHVQVKARVWQALDRAVRDAGLACEAFADGATVEVGEDTDFEPDAVVNCGVEPDLDDVVAPNPVIVVEVLSPSTQSLDTGRKLAGYFAVPSIAHYLIVETRRRLVILHSRNGADIATRIIRAGPIDLAPPGITVEVESFYPA